MWDPKQYGEFSKERFRPAMELMAQIPKGPYSSIIDLGCGTGEFTELLRQEFQPSQLIGLDNSPEMLEKAFQQFPHLLWQQGNIEHLEGMYDLVVSNAALQWVGNHETLFPALLEKTKKVLAIQMPRNYEEPSHVLLRETLKENPAFFSLAKGELREAPVASPEVYLQWLEPKARHINLWETTYYQRLHGENPVLEWVKGTALVPIKACLPKDAYEDFLSLYKKKLLKAYPPSKDGTTLFPFRRLFMVVEKKSAINHVEKEQ